MKLLFKYFKTKPFLSSMAACNSIIFEIIPNQQEIKCSGRSTAQIFTHHWLFAEDIYNCDKIVQFLRLKFDTFLPYCVKGNTALEACFQFLEESCNRGFKAFLNVYSVCHENNDKIYGNSFIVACKTEDNQLYRALNSNTRRKVYESKQFLGACRVLINYDKTANCETSDFLNYVLTDKFVNDGTGNHIHIGVFDQSAKKHDTKSDNKLRTVTLIREAARVLHVLCTEKLGESFYHEWHDSPLDTIKRSFSLLGSFTERTREQNPLVIKQMTIKIAKELTTLIYNFYAYIWLQYCQRESFTQYDGILNSIIKNVKLYISNLKYINRDGLWCLNYDHPPSFLHIQVTKLSAAWFRNAIHPQNTNLLPVFYNNDSQNKSIAVGKFKKTKFISVTCFKPLEDNFFKEISTDSFYNFKHPCYCSKNLLKLWLCSRCQQFLRLSARGYIICSCGKGCLSSMTFSCSSECSLENNNTIATPITTIKRSTQESSIAQICESLSQTFIAKKAKLSLPCQSPTLFENTESMPSPKPVTPQNVPHQIQVYNVLVVGVSGAGKSTLLNSIASMLKHSDYESAISDRTPLIQKHSNEFNGQSVTQQPQDYVLDYENCKIRFIDTPGTNDTRGINQDKDNVKQILEFILKLDEIHAILFVMKNDESKLTSEFMNSMRSLLGLFPRRALNNCSFVYTFAAQTKFQPGAVQRVLETFFEKFISQHAFENFYLNMENQFCVDNAATAAILKNDNQNNVFGECETVWSTTKLTLERFYKRLPLFKPIKKEEIEATRLFEQLGYKLIPHVRNNLVLQTKCLMASVAEMLMTGVAIYCRNSKGDALPLNQNEWLNAIEYWHQNDIEICKLLQELECMNMHRLNDNHKQFQQP